MLGDRVEQALRTVGITTERVERWIGECCCEERKDKLNYLDMWSRRVIRGKLEKAADLLQGAIDEWNTR